MIFGTVLEKRLRNTLDQSARRLSGYFYVNRNNELCPLERINHNT